MDAADVIEHVDILDYIEQYVDLTKQNGDWFGLCPFHAENTPSFSVNTKKSMFYCFGCHTGGDVITFIQKYHKVDFRRAVSMAASYAGLSEEQFAGRLSATSTIKRMFPKKHRAGDDVEQHMILPESIIDRYDPAPNLLSAWADEGISHEVLSSYNVRYDTFNHRIMVPIRDMNGQMINVCARAMAPDWKLRKLSKYTYCFPLGNLDTFFGYCEHAHIISDLNEVILVEGAKSVMLLDTWGIKNSMAALTSTISDEQLLILIRLGVRVVIAFDADVDLREDKKIMKLKRFVRVDWVRNRDNLLDAKMAPVDRGRDVWQTLYERRERLN